MVKNAAQQSVILMEEWKKRSRKYSVYRICLIIALFLGTALLTGILLFSLDSRIPSTIYIRAGEKQQLELHIPATGEVRQASGQQKSNIPKGAVTIDLSGPVTMYTGSQDRFDMQVKLFGFLPMKQVDIRVIQEKELIPLGIPAGIYMHSDGVLVVGIADFVSEAGNKVSPSKNILKSGDYVLQVNGEDVSGKQDLVERIEACQGEKVKLLVRRNGEETELAVMPEKNASGEYKAGLWIRDNVQGVGTMTYMDADGNFGALGHGIADVDTGCLMEVDGGTIYETKIVNVKKGEEGDPGEMTGRIVYAEDYAMGSVWDNSIRGIFGCCNEKTRGEISGEPMPIALKQEIQTGPAQILCTVEEEPLLWDVEITKIHLDHDNVNRGIELRVTDTELLKKTGGIVQGMSGSPIIQNGKLIGAVTHVLVNDPERGYGIFIENMLEENSGRDGNSQRK